jgi:hypothetical protein
MFRKEADPSGKLRSRGFEKCETFEMTAADVIGSSLRP